MKKRLLASIIASCLMLSLVGCGEKEEADFATEEAVTEEVTTEETVETSDVPVLGSENAKGYEGFKYLREEIITTETEDNNETGKKEGTSLCVYIPDEEDAIVNGSNASATSMGVEFMIELGPDCLRDNAEDYLPAENLDYYMESLFDPFMSATVGNKDVVVSKAEEVGENAVSASVEFCRYDDWANAYEVFFWTFYLKELENGEYLMATVEINSTDVTGKAAFLIEELEQFYQFDINWDAERAEQKLLGYETNAPENTFIVGELLFELPQGWKEEDDFSTYDCKMYAPDGDYVFSGCMVAVMKEDSSYGATPNLRSLVDENAKETITTLMGIPVDEYSAEICTTNIGNAAKISCTSSMEGTAVDVILYIVEDGYSIYTLMAVQAEHAIEDAAAVLEGIVTTGRFERY